MAVGFSEDTTPEMMKSKNSQKELLHVITCVTETGAATAHVAHMGDACFKGRARGHIKEVQVQRFPGDAARIEQQPVQIQDRGLRCRVGMAGRAAGRRQTLRKQQRGVFMELMTSTCLALTCLACPVVMDVDAGTAAGLIAKYRPPCPIIVASTDEQVLRQCAVAYGMMPLKVSGHASFFSCCTS